MRIMGLDLGTKRIGVAISDETSTIAQGREVISRDNEKTAILRIKELVSEYNVGEIIIGLPFNMNGTKGERAEDSERFAKKLEDKIDVVIKLWDERLSTVEAESVLLEGDVSRKKRKQVIDKIAAQLILQGYLDSREKDV